MIRFILRPYFIMIFYSIVTPYPVNKFIHTGQRFINTNEEPVYMKSSWELKSSYR